MTKICKYSVLRYVPDSTREEFINIGVVLHSSTDRYIDCRITNNFSRVSVFDDEINIPFLKVILEGLKEDFSNTTVSGPSQEELSNFNYLDNATSIYVNQLQFSRIQLINSTDLDEDLSNLYKAYVHFEVQKKSRLTEQEVRTIMNRVIRTRTSFKNIERNLKVDIGPEQVELDYAYETKNNILKVVKTFSFDYTTKGSSQAPQLAKEWAYNFNRIKYKSNLKEQFTLPEIDFTTLVYVKSLTKNIRIALDILQEETHTIKVENEFQIQRFADGMVEDTKTS